MVEASQYLDSCSCTVFSYCVQTTPFDNRLSERTPERCSKHLYKHLCTDGNMPCKSFTVERTRDLAWSRAVVFEPISHELARVFTTHLTVNSGQWISERIFFHTIKGMPAHVVLLVATYNFPLFTKPSIRLFDYLYSIARLRASQKIPRIIIMVPRIATRARQLRFPIRQGSNSSLFMTRLQTHNHQHTRPTLLNIQHLPRIAMGKKTPLIGLMGLQPEISKIPPFAYSPPRYCLSVVLNTRDGNLIGSALLWKLNGEEALG